MDVALPPGRRSYALLGPRLPSVNLISIRVWCPAAFCGLGVADHSAHESMPKIEVNPELVNGYVFPFILGKVQKLRYCLVY